MEVKALYCFNDLNMEEDLVNNNGKITRYKETAIIAISEEDARSLGKLDSEYSLSRIEELGKDWN